MMSWPSLLWWNVPWHVPLLTIVGGAFLWWLAERRIGDQQLCRVLLWSYGLRVALAVLLFATSYWGWPFFKSLQLSKGFWAFAVDSGVYHHYGRLIAEAWAKGIEVPNPELGVEYFAVVAAMYRLCGAHLLYPILLNCVFASLCGVFAYLIARRLSGRQMALISAALVSFWPSSLMWSSQLLKDALSWCLILVSLWLILTMIPGTTPGRRQRPWAWAGLALGLVSAVILLTRLRAYLGTLLLWAALIVFVPAAGYAFIRTQRDRGWRYVSLTFLLVLSVLFARTLNTLELMSPRHPEWGHYRLARQHWQQGKLPDAAGEFRNAIALKEDFKEAYLGLGAIEAQQGHLEEAAQVYTTLLKHEQPARRSPIKTILAQIHLQRGNAFVDQGDLDEASLAYERALQFHPTSALTYANYGIVLSRQRRFDLAEQILDKAGRYATTGLEQDRVNMAHEWISVLEERIRAEQERITAKEERLTAEQALAVAVEERIKAQQDLAQAAQERIKAQQDLAQTAQERIKAQPDLAQTAQERVKAEQDLAQAVQDRVTAEQKQMKAKQERVKAEQNLEEAEQKRMNAEERLVAVQGKLQQNRDALMTMALAAFAEPSGGSAVTDTVSAQRSSTPVRHPLAQIDDQARVIVQESSPGSLGSLREGFVASGGHSLTDPRALISDPYALLTYLPRALTIGFLAPLPWQWFDTKGSTGIMRAFSGVEMLLLYFLLPLIVVGVCRVVRQRRADGLYVLVFVLLTATSISLVVANVGTLFRLRLQFLLPLLIFGAIGRPRGISKALIERLPMGRRLRVRESSGGDQTPVVEPDGAPITLP